MSTHRLFTPYKLGTIELKNRVVMSPMTRSRAIENIPNDLMAEYYSQRANAGLIVTEGTSPSANGLGYARIPGIFSDEQVTGWKKVTDAVHKKGGRIFIQIMHTGRVGHPVNLPSGAELVGASAIGVKGTVWTDSEGNKEYGVPREMSRSDVQKTIQEYVKSSENAIRAGFDGVELHGANGYLIDQFLNPSSNHRTDDYGGSAANRNRFAIEVATAVAKAIGADKVGIRISPYGVFNDMQSFEGLEDQYEELAKAFGRIGLTYIHIVDHSSMGAPKPEPSTVRKIREAYKAENATGTFILSGGYDLARSETDLTSGAGDLIAFGRPYISNPDLVDRLEKELPLAEPDAATFYTPGEKGYTDYAYVAK